MHITTLTGQIRSRLSRALLGALLELAGGELVDGEVGDVLDSVRLGRAAHERGEVRVLLFPGSGG